MFFQRDEYEYLPEIPGRTSSKYQPTILRPPRADDLAHIGTLRLQNGLENPGFYHDERISPEQFSSSQQWFELQSPVINTAQLSAADYEIYSHSTNDYSYRQPPPRPIFIDFRSYRDEDDEMENYRLDSFPHPQVHRLDTSTEYYGMRYTNVIPKSILKSGLNTTPPSPIIDYLQIDHAKPTWTSEEPLPELSHAVKKRIPIETIFAPPAPKYRMKFAYINELNEIDWEMPGEFQTIFQSKNEQIPSLSSWQHSTDNSQLNYSWSNEMTQQKAFEY